MSSTPYFPEVWQIKNPQYYTKVPWDKLKVNYYYTYQVGNLQDRVPYSCVKILVNNENEIKFEMFNKEYTIDKKDATERQREGFYEKNIYHNRESYLKLGEGLEIDPTKKQPENLKYLFNPDVQKEIASNLGGRKRKSRKSRKSRKIRKTRKSKKSKKSRK